MFQSFALYQSFVMKRRILRILVKGLATASRIPLRLNPIFLLKGENFVISLLKTSLFAAFVHQQKV